MDTPTQTRFKFTAKKLESLKPPPFIIKNGERQVQKHFYWQGDGLGLCISSTNARSWVFVYRITEIGKRVLRRDVLGPYTFLKQPQGSALTLQQANEKADHYRRLLREGKDPRREEEDRQREEEDRARAAQAEAANTFRHYAEKYLTLYRPTKGPNRTELRPKTKEEYRRHLLVDFQSLHDRPLRAITKKHISEALDEIQQRIPGSGINNCLKTIRAMFNWAMRRGDVDLPPTAGMGMRVAPTIKERHLCGDSERNEPSEIVLFWRGCEALGSMGIWPRIALLTGTRRGEAAEMRWEEIIELNGKRPRWIVPVGRSKTWTENVLPLGPLAVELIQQRPRIEGCPYVHTTDGQSPQTGYSDFKELLDRTISTLKAQDPKRYEGQLERPWGFHALRHTVKTGLAGLGIPREVRDKILGHALDGMEKVYNHAALMEEKRAAVIRWERHILDLLAADADATKVMPIARKRSQRVRKP